MALKISKRSALPAFEVMQVMARAAKIEQETGENVIHLEVGQPSTPAPAPARRAIIEAMEEPASHGYTLTKGIGSVRAAIAEHYEQRHGLEVSAENVALTVGSSMGFLLSYIACFEAGDRIAMTSPGYSAYRKLMTTVGLEPIMIEVTADGGWKLTPELLDEISGKIDGLIIANPSNPTGAVMSTEEVAAITHWCDEHEVRLISDEIYHGITFGCESCSVLASSKNAIVVNSFSKYFSMTGHRIGWVVVPDDLIDPFYRLSQSAVISVPTLSQIAGRAAISEPDSIKELESHVERYKNNRDILLTQLDKRLVGNVAPPEGAFYLYIDTSAFSDDSNDFANRLLNEAKVATTPGIDFDSEKGHMYLRLSFSGSEADIREGVKRINTWFSANFD